MRRVNPDTLEVEEYVYVLHESGSWDYEQTVDIQIFSEFNKALNVFTQKVADTKTNLREWCDEDDLIEDEDMNKDEGRASYSGYQEDEYEKLHYEIYIEKMEVK